MLTIFGGLLMPFAHLKTGRFHYEVFGDKQLPAVLLIMGLGMPAAGWPRSFISMLLEKSLADMQGSTVKLQLVGDAPQELDILNATVSGRLKTLIVRGEAEEVGAKMAACKPAYFDVLPLSDGIIFSYCKDVIDENTIGVDYEIKDILL